eukprot:CAMPEP_0202955670 /NCGR_PEP_ID=MMETSP1396-20130829/205_1 /ASSEMBLY_ACC=CAM_ASM_000872 /TAXON_ID= /ORGANISM="Pseudokeronopsis sp., Strain Brazil" /LENGTH=133 /DNA_ID=CAMNT_0049672335 /DNA_START=19 /DNA_END=420 /DNA_ORIENTATION=-
MSEKKFTLYCRKFLKNPLLSRKQLQIELIHADQANVAKEAIKTALAKKFNVKEEVISVYGLKTKFGGGRSSGFALIYDSLDAKKKFDIKTLLRRDKHMGKNAKTRKQKKEIKGRQLKVRGIAKEKAAQSGGKK